MRPPSLVLERRRSGSVMSVPEDAPLASDSPWGCFSRHNTPPMATPPYTLSNFSFNVNPRTRLLRRSSSVSTLGSIDDDGTSAQHEDLEWSTGDMERLNSVYEQCVREASFDTPFSGAPPSQLLHTIARACKRVYKDEWTYSLHQTRIKVAELAKRKLAEDDLLWESHQAAGGSADGSSNMLDATPRPAESDMDATPRRHRPRRNDSMDFLPHTRNLAAAARLSDRLHASSEIPPALLLHARSKTEYATLGASLYPSSGSRSARAMTFGSSSSLSCIADEHLSLGGAARNLSSNVTDDAPVRPMVRTSSGVLPLSTTQASYFARPSLFSAPSFSGSTPVMQMQQEMSYAGQMMGSITSGHHDPALYGSSAASDTSFMTATTTTTTTSGSSATSYSSCSSSAASTAAASPSRHAPIYGSADAGMTSSDAENERDGGALHMSPRKRVSRKRHYDSGSGMEQDDGAGTMPSPFKRYHSDPSHPPPPSSLSLLSMSMAEGGNPNVPTKRTFGKPLAQHRLMAASSAPSSSPFPMITGHPHTHYRYSSHSMGLPACGPSQLFNGANKRTAEGEVEMEHVEEYEDIHAHPSPQLGASYRDHREKGRDRPEEDYFGFTQRGPSTWFPATNTSLPSRWTSESSGPLDILPKNGRTLGGPSLDSPFEGAFSFSHRRD